MKSRIQSMIIRFLVTFRGRDSNVKFSLKHTGIPYNEIAKMYAVMDINETEKRRRLKEANELFNDVTEFFESPAKQKYLTTVISKSNVEQILSEIEECFVEDEDFEKCSQIQQWRKKL